MPAPIPVLITSRNRGLYLWACLDSLFKYTKYPALFIIGDNASDEPLVRKVIEGFQRRGMLHRVFLREKNEPDLMEFLLRENRDLLGEYFASIESDVMVLPQDPCWLTRFVGLMEKTPKLAMLGSFLDKSDFIEPETARRLAPNASAEQIAFLTKANSPERTLESRGEDLVLLPATHWPHNPPGRLLIRRVEPVEKLFKFQVKHLNDSTWHQALVKGGWQTGVAMNVLHRHLSLTNAFDYPEYDNRLRDWFFNERKREYRDELKREAMPPIAPPVHRAPAAGGATKLSNRAIIVLGMHRSGTSAISGLLALHGVEMGRHLMPATVDNEAGYWEHAEIVQIHDEMLAALGSGWDDVCHLPSGWERSDTVAPFQQRLAEVLLRDFAASPFWAIKDPRLCRVWPLWEIILRELECQPFPVLMVRHPFETIRSLEKRDGFPPAKSELLWLQHLIESEGETRNAARVVVTFDQVLENPAVVFGRIKGALGGEWPRKPVPDEFARFLDPQKRHHRTPGTEGLSAWTLAAFEAAQRGAAGDDAAMRTGLDSVRVALESADALYRGELDTLFTLRAEFREAKRKLSAKSTQAKQLKEQVRALKQQVRALEKTAPVKFARFLKRLSGRPRNAPRVS